MPALVVPNLSVPTLLGAVKMLIEAEADPRSLSGGRSPLVNAAKTGQATCLELMLSKSKSKSKEEDTGIPAVVFVSPTVEAIDNGHWAVLRTLLDAKAELPRTALKMALSKGHDSVVSNLLSTGSVLGIETTLN